MNTPICENCARAAGPDDRFCGGCGSSLAPPCVHCGRKLAPDAKFCTGCGHPVGHTSTSVMLEDRRQISVLFVDMSGFTVFSELADPEQIRTLQHEYFASVREVLRHYGGVVEKYIGDAVMAVFGAPVATENDALRAVRAGIEVQRVLRRSKLGATGVFRVGVATGEALVDVSATRDGGQAMISGDVVNTASRLQSTAPDYGVVVCENTMSMTKEDVEYDEQPSLTWKGRSTSRRIFLAKSARLSRRDRDESTPMVNREHEQGLLITALHRAIRESSPQLVTIFGTAGMGKSRLLRELSRHAERIPETSVVWRVGHCPPFGENVTYAALAEIVKAQVGILDTDDEATARSRLDTALRAITNVQEAARLADALGPLVGLPGAGLSPGETESAWRRFLLAVSGNGPTVLVFEDMHWADEAMLRFVEMLGNVGPGVPLLVVATARPELRERHPDWTSAVTGAVSLSLGPMHDEHIATMYGLMFGQAVFPNANVAPLVELAGGNPLYAHEFVRMLVERGELVPYATGGVLTGEAMPQTVQAVIANRLDLLDSADRAVLQAAAVIGINFWPGAVAATLNISVETVRRALYRLQQRDLVSENSTSAMAGEPEFAFRHVLVRDVCYQRLPRTERVSRHERAADWLERVSEARINDLAEVLANHRWAAHEIARVLGLDLSNYAPAARTALHRAARRAYSLDAVSTASTLVERALSLKLDHDPVLELFAAELALMGDAEAFLAGGGMQRLTELSHSLTERGDEAGAARALTLLGTAAWTRADRDGALSYLDEAVRRYTDLPDSNERAQALLELARVRMMDLETGPAIMAAEQAAALADRAGLAEVKANAQITSALARFLAGDSTGLSDLEQVTDLCREHRLVARRRALHNLAYACLEEGDLARHDKLRGELRSLDSTGGQTLATSFADEASEAYFTGDWARQVAATILRPAAEWDPNSAMTTAWIQVLRGEPGNDKVVADVLQSARRSGFHRPLRSAVAHAALYRALQGNLEEGRALLAELDRDWRAAIALPFGEWVAAAGHAGALLGAEAAEQVHEMLRLSPRQTPWVAAALATVEGDHLAAAEQFSRIGDASDRALSLAWAQRAGGLDDDYAAELAEFVTRNEAPLLLG